MFFVPILLLLVKILAVLAMYLKKNKIIVFKINFLLSPPKEAGGGGSKGPSQLHKYSNI